MTSGRAVVAMAALTAALLPGCGVRGLNFLTDKRLDIVSPGDRDKVTVPVTLRWKVKDFDVTGRDGSRRGDAGYFGVFVDRAPQPPGKTLEWMVRNDELCKRTPDCPNAQYLADFDIFSTTETEFTVRRLRGSKSKSDRRDRHEVIIVLLNGRGERIGESVFKREFEVERPD